MRRRASGSHRLSRSNAVLETGLLSLNLAFRRLLSLPTNTWSQFRERSIQCFQLSVCLSVCSDDNDTKCSKLLRASLRGTSGTNTHRSYNNTTLFHTFGGKLMSINSIYLYINIYNIVYYIQFM